MGDIQVMDDVWIDGSERLFGIVLDISKPFKSGNYTELDGTPILGREYIIFVPEEAEDD